ncbi:putative tubby-like protein [Helianthus anomalus]
MAKVYSESETIIPVVNTKNPILLTVWKKSLIFSCDGFTVYNSNGNLAFRVDNYFVKGNREIVLIVGPTRRMRSNLNLVMITH